jgi:hypothetical protein
MEESIMRPLPWSHSALSDYLNCPKAYYEKRVTKSVIDPPNDAGLAGDWTHKQFEVYLKNGTPLPSTYPLDIREWPVGLKAPSAYKGYLDKIAAMPGTLFVENKLAITRELEPCDFFSPDVWCRAILDIIVIDGQTATVIDHKSGKRKMDTRQLKLAALMTFIHYPQVDIVRTGYAWLKDHVLDKKTYVRTGEAELWAEFLPDLRQYKQAYKTMTFGPRPSGLCNGWCPVTSCEFWKPKRSK